MSSEYKKLSNFSEQAERAAQMHQRTMSALREAFPDAVFLQDEVVIEGRDLSPEDWEKLERVMTDGCVENVGNAFRKDSSGRG